MRVLDVRAIEQLLDRSNGHRGIAALRGLVAYDPSPAANARSEHELRFLDLVREAGLSPPQVNVLERDHARLGRLRLAEYEALALTWLQVTGEPAWVVSAITSLLARAA